MHSSTSPSQNGWPSCSQRALAPISATIRRARWLAGSKPNSRRRSSTWAVAVHGCPSLTLGEPARNERAARPLTVLVLTRERPRAPARGLDPGAFGAPLRLRRAEEVAHDLPADRRIGCEQPVDQRNPTAESALRAPRG